MISPGTSSRAHGPNFFVIGAGRSGTTALTEMLRGHPDVFVTEPKEPHFLAYAGRELTFDGPGDELTVNRYAVTDAADYLNLYRHASGRAARGDASVSTLFHAEQSLDTLARHFQDARLVVLLREPVARAFSAYSYLRIRGFEPRSDFLVAVEEEVSGRRGTWQHLWHYVDMGRYARQLDPFLCQFGAERVLVLFHDDLRTDPAGVARRAFGFLGVDPRVEVPHSRVNTSGATRSSVIQHAIRWTSRQPLIRTTVQRSVPYRVRERIKQFNISVDPLPAHARTVLEEIFEPEVTELAALLSSWYGVGLQFPEWLSRVPAHAPTESP